MSIIDKICEVWGRTLSPIETQKIINLSEEFDDDVLIEAALISVDKTHPMAYMSKILYYVKNPLEQSTKKKEIKEENNGNEDANKWLEDFKKRHNGGNE